LVPRCGVVLAIALVGYGWWTNFKIYKRDKKAMENELLADLNALRAELVGSITKGVEGLPEKLGSKMNERLTALDERLADAARGTAKGLIEEQKRRKYDDQALEAKLWLIRSVPVPSNTLTCYERMFEIGRELSDEWLIRNALKEIINLTSERAVDGYDFPRFLGEASKLPSQYSENVQRIRDIARKRAGA
jgi:hypothetical protein